MAWFARAELVDPLEVAVFRWLQLCPVRKTPACSPAEPELAAIVNVPERLAEIRLRLSEISWLMRMISESFLLVRREKMRGFRPSIGGQRTRRPVRSQRNAR